VACRRLELAPRRCVVIEDAPAGIEAAVAAGARAVAVLLHHPRASFAAADHVVERLQDLTVCDLISLGERE